MAEVKYTFCRICESSCGLIACIENNTITSIQSNPDHVVSLGYACKKGLKFHELEHSPDRLKYPLKRSGGDWERISWSRALREIGAKVRDLRKKNGPDSIAMYIGSGAGFATIHPVFAQGFMSAVGSRNMFSSSSQDCSNKFAVAQHLYGSPAIQTFPDIDNTRCLIIIGANPASSHMSFMNAPNVMKRLKLIEKRGGRVIFINPRRTESARALGRQVFIRPGTDIFFLMAFARELIMTGGVNRERVDRYMKNFPLFESTIMPWTPEKTEKVTGISSTVLRDMVELYSRSRGSALYCSTGINQSGNGTLCFWVLEAINAISGNLDSKGGTVVGRGIFDLPELSRRFGALMRKDSTRIGGFPSVFDTFPGGILHDEITTPGKGQVRALFVSGGNPLLTMPDTARFKKALKKLELLVSVDIFRNETANLAHYILPGITFMQRPDINFLFQSMMGVMSQPVLNYSDRVIEPIHEQRDEMWIYRELTRAAGLKLFGSVAVQGMFGLERALCSLPLFGKLFRISPERLFSLMLRFSGKATLKKAREHPHGLLLGPLEYGSFLGKRVCTPDGLIDLAPEIIVKNAEKLESQYKHEIKNTRRIKLVNKRELLSFNTYMHNAPSLVRGDRNTNYCYINPLDAKKRGLKQGDAALVKSAHGSIRIPVMITEDMMPGTAAIPHGWGHEDADGLSVACKNHGVNVNRLTGSGADSIDPVSGMAHLSGVLVEISK